jgi:hypothetical protein
VDNVDKLLTQRDLADRWQVSVRAIEKWRSEGILQPAKGVPVIRFTAQYIAELEGVELKATSPLRVRRLEREIERLQRENEELRGAMTNALSGLAGLFAKGGKMDDRTASF